MSELQLPDPFVPVDVDLNGYEYMPLYGERLRTSETNTRATDAEFRAMLNLWWSAWMQVPASSLPADDLTLCRLADLGRDVKAWLKVKPVAMRNFVLCNDGRFYHTFLAVKAMEAWELRVKARVKGKQGAAKRWSSHRKTMPEPVDNDARATGNACPGHQDPMPQPHDNDASAIEKHSKRSDISSRNTVQGRDSAHSRPVHNPEKDQSKPKATFTPSNDHERRLLSEGERYGLSPGNNETWKQFENRLKLHRNAA